MRLDLSPAPWLEGAPGPTLLGAIEVISGSVWRDAATDFYAVREAKLRSGQRPPMGVQKYLNRVLDERFKLEGWEGGEGRFLKDRAWLRVTFRHQMSLGADFLDALRLVKKDGAIEVAICAATSRYLSLVSPQDAKILVSYEKLVSLAAELHGVLDIPLWLGRLTPMSPLPPQVADALRAPRPRQG